MAGTANIGSAKARHAKSVIQHFQWRGARTELLEDVLDYTRRKDEVLRKRMSLRLAHYFLKDIPRTKKYTAMRLAFGGQILSAMVADAKAIKEALKLRSAACTAKTGS